MKGYAGRLREILGRRASLESMYESAPGARVMSASRKDIERELRELASEPLTMPEIARLELEAIDQMIRSSGAQRDHAKLVLRAMAEIRRARDAWDEQPLTQREIDDEVAMLRGES